ncbi:hypothetical protein HG535_0D04300 [Zygotorulaspora mrakii]|uniref:Letm1 RBD domain-containing protein n=1 Tax=Zygotorulaspora mrakii TaxID=42260 RepID=A0A7H9B4N9_ZYGMR|nr:uncharacterized protein HG535_0D04300 [Zygotorulaspora mrakii]QLG72722.1 hypothetical protein HG535_0D04300 [Zygotorulaspora mrakii]
MFRYNTSEAAVRTAFSTVSKKQLGFRLASKKTSPWAASIVASSMIHRRYVTLSNERQEPSISDVESIPRAKAGKNASSPLSSPSVKSGVAKAANASASNTSNASSAANAPNTPNAASSSAVPPSSAASSSPAPNVSKPKKTKEPLMQRIKHEIKHYVNGTKLLGFEIKVSTKLLFKFVQGYELTRREINQLKRTMGDIFRLVPFSAFLIIPFAELLLPVALKIFPNLLPSTYESGKDKQAKRNKLIEIRKKTSDFLHDTLEESSLLSYNSIESTEKKKTFLNFFKKLYSPKDGKANVFTHEEILTVAKMFKNDTVLDNLSRPQLVAMSKFMSITPFGNDNMLRYQIRHSLKKIMGDDKVIDYEGINSLSTDEIYLACVSRGVKAYGVPTEELKENLKVWLDLRLRQKVPSVLLVLSSTYTFGGLEKRHEMNQKAYSPIAEEKEKKNRYDELMDVYYDGILQVLSSIPDPVYNVAKLDVSESKSPAAPTPPATVASEHSDSGPVASANEVLKSLKEAGKEPNDFAEAAEEAQQATKAAEKQPSVAVKTSEPAKEEQTEEVEKQHEEEEPISRTDENEFKLNVLKEQEALIKKEQEEAKERTSALPISDDITLDEDDKSQPPIPTDQAPETKVIKKE